MTLPSFEPPPLNNCRGGTNCRAVTALGVLKQLQDISKAGYVSPFDFATVYVGLGEKDQGLAWLEKAVAVHNFPVIYLKVDPRFDSLRSDPRYTDLLHRIGLPQ
jgi:hypothetical protein